MNCPKCGAALPQGAQVCPTCGEPLAPYYGPAGNAGWPTYGYPSAPGYAAYPGAQPQPGQQPPAMNQPTAQPVMGQPMGQAAAQPAMGQPAMGQPAPQPAQPTAYPGYGYQQPYAGYPQGFRPAAGAYASTREPNPFLAAMSGLPKVIATFLRDPGETLRGLLERGDVYTGAVIAFVTLALTFLGAMIVARGCVALLFSAISTLTGASLAGDAAGLNQGVSYIAGRVAPSVGGVAALCQLAATAFPAATLMVYVCAMRKAVRFSLPLLCGCVALTTLPTLFAAPLGMLASLISPALTLIVMAFGTVVSAVVFSALLERLTGQTGATLPKAICICLYTLATLLFMLVVGGALMGGVLRGMVSLMGSMSSML